MAMKACRECKEEVSTAAKTCPKCGTPHPTTATSKGMQGCLGCLGVIVLFGIVSTFAGGGGSSGGGSTTANRTPAPASAGVLYHAPQSINVREGPGTNFGTAYTLNFGDRVFTARGTSADGWAPVHSGPAGADTIGYVFRELLRPGAPPDLLVGAWDFERGQFGNLYIVGTVKNTRARPYSYVQITFALFDQSDARIGTAMDNLNNLAAGGTWRFRAGVLQDGRVTARFDEITGW